MAERESMRYLHKINAREIIRKYDYIIGWGTGPILRMNYQTKYFKMDYLIDGTEKMVGRKYKGIDIMAPNVLEKLEGKKLVVIYAIYEAEILGQISEYGDEDTDVIIYSFLDIILDNGYKMPEINGKNGEDILLISLIKQIGLDSVKYIEIGVCHPVIRNNTFILNEIFGGVPGYQGCLVEANPLCWDLITAYRKEDDLVKAGIGQEQNQEEMQFFAFPDFLGHSTFKKEIADEIRKAGYQCIEYKIPIISINRLIKEKFESTPDILALDAEGLDYEIICDWDAEKYPFKIVVTEIMNQIEESIEDKMEEKGYKMYAKTMENILWVKKEYKIFV